MKSIKFLLFSTIILFTAFSLYSCDDNKDDEEKHAKVFVAHTYNNQVLTVNINNTNVEDVTVELNVRYTQGALAREPQYITDKIKMKGGEKIQKHYTFSGEMPVITDFQYKVY